MKAISSTRGLKPFLVVDLPVYIMFCHSLLILLILVTIKWQNTSKLCDCIKSRVGSNLSSSNFGIIKK